MSRIGSSVTSRRSFIAQSSATIALSRLPIKAGLSLEECARPSPLGSVVAGGDLAHRASQNMERLHSDIYSPPLVFEGRNAKSWPGDFEGRALLALTLLGQSTGREPEYLESMFAEYKKHVNAEGYFGELLDVRAINEQQLSGQGWFLRSLCEYYEYKKDATALEMVRTIVQKFAVPLRGHYRTYPIEPSRRSHHGGVSGTLAAQEGEWVLSTDIGCAFICLDGLTQAWTLLKDPDLKALIDEAITRFLEADLIVMGAQTHASLTCMRAILRVYGETHDAALLKAVQDRYSLYRSVGMTEHYANYNWFSRPETWTEPCAIIDSFMVANQLWQITGDPTYLEDAHLIWFNGVGRGMRGNGGFGTDLCAGYRTPFLKVRSYEAYFCCTMRGGEGHARAVQYCYSTRPRELTVSFFNDSLAHFDLGNGNLSLRQTASYPYSGTVRLEVVSSSCNSAITLRLFAPYWMSEHSLEKNGLAIKTAHKRGFVVARFTPKTGDVLILRHELVVTSRKTLNPNSLQGYYAFQAGPLMLGHTGEKELHIPRSAQLVEMGEGRYRIPGTEETLSRINDLNDSNALKTDPCTRQVLFRQA